MNAVVAASRADATMADGTFLSEDQHGAAMSVDQHVPGLVTHVQRPVAINYLMSILAKCHQKMGAWNVSDRPHAGGMLLSHGLWIACSRLAPTSLPLLLPFLPSEPSTCVCLTRWRPWSLICLTTSTSSAGSSLSCATCQRCSCCSSTYHVFIMHHHLHMCLRPSFRSGCQA